MVYAIRIHSISKSWIASALGIFLSVGCLGCGLTVAGVGVNASSLPAFLNDFGPLITTYMVTEAVIDVFIAVVLCWHLKIQSTTIMRFACYT